MNSERRRFLRTLAVTGALLVGDRLSLRPVRAQSAEPLVVKELRDSLFLVTGAGGNVVLLADPLGGAMVDSGLFERGGELRQLVRRTLGNVSLRTLFNTHWRPAHTGGNDVFAADDLTIVAHENTRLWMSTTFYVDWERRRFAPRAMPALPNETFFSSDPQPREVAVGSGTALYGHLPEACTDGDIFVRFPERNVVVAGGALTVGRYPLLDYITGGWIGGLIAATQQLIDMSDSDTLVVPDVGLPQRRTDLEAQRDMLIAVRERIEAFALEGKGVKDMIEARITKEFDSRYGSDSSLFISNAYEGMWWSRIRGMVA